MQNNHSMYVALICDIQNSKKLKEKRKTCQLRLIEAIDEVNRVFQEELVFEFKIYNGDEFQGMLKTSKILLEVIYFLENQLYPLKINVGIGIGELDTKLMDLDTFTNDGQVYHYARAALNEVKDLRVKKVNINSNIIFKMANLDKVLEKNINSIFSLSHIIRDGWTDKQVEVIKTLESCDGIQNIAAKQLEVSHTNVSRALERAKYYSFREAYKNLSLLISDLGD